MSAKILTITAVVTLAATFAAAPQAKAQYLDPRAGQALQICASPLGAGIPECAQLGLGGGASAAGAAANAGGILGAIGTATGNGQTAGLLGGLLGAARGAQAQAAPAPNVAGANVNAAAIQAQYAACSQAAGLNQAALQQCANTAQMQGGMQPQYANPGAPVPGYNPNQTAMNIYSGAAAYTQCVSKLTGPVGGINACTPLLSGGTVQLPAAGGAAPAAAAAAPRPAAADPLAALLGLR